MHIPPRPAPDPLTERGINARDLVKRYGQVEALRGVSFTVKPGEIVGFLGPNGAGKTTTLKLLTCALRATSGQALVAGLDVRRHSAQVRQRIGYLPEHVPLHDTMLVYDYLMFIAELRGVPAARRRVALLDTARQTGLSAMLGRAISELSKGYRQRVGLAQAIIHAPEVVILDEPTTGLDPNQIVEIRDLIKQIGQEKTVLFSTHIMQEVAAVCDRVLILDRGELVADGTVSELTHELSVARRGLEVSLGPEVSEEGLRAALGELPGLEVEVISARADERLMWVSAPDLERLRRRVFELAARADAPIEVRGARPYEATLERVFHAWTVTRHERPAVRAAATPPPVDPAEATDDTATPRHTVEEE